MPVPPLPISVAASSNSAGAPSSLLGEPLRVRDHRLAHGVDEVDRAQLSLFAEAGDDHRERPRHREHVVRVLADVAEDLVHADAVGIDARGERAAHRPADQLVDHRFGAGERERSVMADDERLVDELQIGVEHRHVQRAARRSRAHRFTWQATRRRRARRPGVDGGVDGCTPRDGRLRTTLVAAAAERDGDARRLERVEQRGLAVDEQLEIGVERLRDGRQVAVRGVDLPRANPRQARARERHATVADGVGVLEAALAHEEAARRERSLADDEQHLLHVGAELRDLLVELAAQRDRLVENALRRRAPSIDRLLHAFVVPEAALEEALEVLVGELLPGLAAVERVRRVEQRRLQLQEARHSGHHRARAAVVEQRAERGERVAEGVVARERLHRRPRSAVRGSEHQHPRAVARQHALPGLGLLDRHRARDQAAHRVGDDAHRLLARRARGERRVDRVGETARLVLDRSAPVVAERDHLVAVGEALDEVAVDAADRPVGLDARRRLRIPGERIEAVDEAKAEPDALAVLLQVRAEDAGKDEHRGPIGRARRVAGAARARDRERGARPARILARPRERADRREVGRSVVEQRGRDRLHRALVAEVVEVRDLAALVEQEARAAAVRGLRPRRAAVHRARLHDQVVVGPVEGVGEQRLDPRGDRVALHVAGDDAQLAGNRLGCAVQPGDDRARRASSPRGPEARRARRGGARPRAGNRPPPERPGCSPARGTS